MTPLNLFKTNQNLLRRGPGAAPGRPGGAPGGPGPGPGQGPCVSLGFLWFQWISESVFLLTVSLDSAVTVYKFVFNFTSTRTPGCTLVLTFCCVFVCCFCIQSDYRHKITQIRYRGLKRTKKPKENKQNQRKTKQNLRYQGTLVSPSMFLSVCSDCRLKDAFCFFECFFF